MNMRALTAFGKKLLAVSAASSVLLVSAAHADWKVENENSRVSFITTKNENVAEVSRFNQVTGVLSDSGRFELSIPLQSVNTAIEIRDQRMRDLLFEVVKFPELKLNAQVDAALINQLKAGQSIQQEVAADISLHGQKAAITFKLLISKLAGDKLLVNSLEPVVVNAQVFDLYNGVEKLRKIAGLPSISKAVPVSFVLSLTER